MAKKSNKKKNKKAVSLKTIKAEPGFTVLYYDRTADEVLSRPVIAWCIESGSLDVIPISVIGSEDVWNNSLDNAIQLPDGRVMVDYDRFFNNFDEWLALVNKPRVVNVTEANGDKKSAS